MNDDKRAHSLIDPNRLTMAYERAHQAFAKATSAQNVAKAAIFVAAVSIVLTIGEIIYIFERR